MCCAMRSGATSTAAVKRHGTRGGPEDGAAADLLSHASEDGEVKVIGDEPETPKIPMIPTPHD